MAVNSENVVSVFPDVGIVDGITPVREHFVLGKIPMILTGKGTPDGDRVPFLVVPKGSLYLQMDAEDDAVCLFAKVDDAGEDADWNSLALSA